MKDKIWGYAVTTADQEAEEVDLANADPFGQLTADHSVMLAGIHVRCSALGCMTLSCEWRLGAHSSLVLVHPFVFFLSSHLYLYLYASVHFCD